MEYTCSNSECGKTFENNSQGEIEEIDKDQYSTMYRETKFFKCPYCDNEMEVEDEYWENDETGDITR